MAETSETTLWHSLADEDLPGRLKTDGAGLSSDEARRRLESHGKNVLGAEEATHPLRLVLKQVGSPLIYLLIAASVISLLTGHAIDAAVIFGVVIINTILGFTQEWRAERALDALHRMAAPHARVWRDGGEQDVAASDVVPGDVLVLKAGDRVAADARVMESDNLRTDESSLTGESEPVTKKTGALPDDTSLADRANMVWMSSPVTDGAGRALVVATGMDTAMGEIAGKVRATQREETPLQRKLARLGVYIGLAGIALAGGIFLLGLARGYEAMEMVLFAIAVAVSAIPEGLPAVISVTLALGVQRMARENAIVRRLPAVETLGATTVICSDKTGTITQNQMTAVRLWAGGRTYEVTGGGYDPSGTIQAEGGAPLDAVPDPVRRLLAVGVLANDAQMTREEERWTVRGSPTEGAILVAASKGGLDPDALRRENPRAHAIPFTSTRRYMATLNTTPEGASVIYVKGAPDRLIAACSHILEDGQRVPLDEARRRRVVEINETFAKQALRVLGGAWRECAEPIKDFADPSVAEKGLTFAGLWGIVDPPRPEAVEAIRRAREAGMHVVMLTGDHAVTATAIARQVGITEEGEATTGAQTDGLSPEELADRALNTGVFARVSPAHKLNILEALKARREVVAMTGDGVNDAPALKGADIGVAMGRAGTEVAKEAADMVLTDDNFATIVHAVEEGRTIYKNLRRVIFFLVAANAGELLTLGGALAIGMPLPLSPVMVLWINLITASACTIPLGLEPRHRDVLRQPPLPREAHILDRVVLRRIALLAPVMAVGTLGVFAWMLRHSDYATARTAAFTTMVAFEWFQGFNARSSTESIFSIGPFSNRWLLLGIGVAVLLQLAALYTRVGNTLIGSTPLSAGVLGSVVIVASTIMIADELLKRIGAHRRPHESVPAGQ